MGCYPSAHADDDSPTRQVGDSHSTPGTYYNTSKPFKRAGLTWSSDTPITVFELEQKRRLFWETAHVYGGRLEIWQALQAAFAEEDIMMARSILEAANVTLPTGNPCDGCFDELGHNYEIPMYCIIPPSNLVNETDETTTTTVTTTTTTTATTTTAATTSMQATEVTALKNEKDSGIDTDAIKQSPQTMIPPDCSDNPYFIVVRLSTNHDIKIAISTKEETVASLRSRIFNAPDSNLDPHTHSLRFIYLGKVLKDSTRIICGDSESNSTKMENAIRVNKESVIQALVSKL